MYNFVEKLPLSKKLAAVILTRSSSCKRPSKKHFPNNFRMKMLQKYYRSHFQGPKQIFWSKIANAPKNGLWMTLRKDLFYAHFQEKPTIFYVRRRNFHCPLRLHFELGSRTSNAGLAFSSIPQMFWKANYWLKILHFPHLGCWPLMRWKFQSAMNTIKKQMQSLDLIKKCRWITTFY